MCLGVKAGKNKVVVQEKNVLLWTSFCVQCLVAALDVCIFYGSIKIASTEHFPL